jgi:hypothetical protein
VEAPEVYAKDRKVATMVSNRSSTPFAESATQKLQDAIKTVDDSHVNTPNILALDHWTPDVPKDLVHR